MAQRRPTTARPATPVNGTALGARMDQLEARLAEQQAAIERLAGAIAGVLAQQLQPQMQQGITQGLLNPPQSPRTADTAINQEC